MNDKMTNKKVEELQDIIENKSLSDVKSSQDTFDSDLRFENNDKSTSEEINGIVNIASMVYLLIIGVTGTFLNVIALTKAMKVRIYKELCSEF